MIVNGLRSSDLSFTDWPPGVDADDKAHPFGRNEETIPSNGKLSGHHCGKPYMIAVVAEAWKADPKGTRTSDQRINGTPSRRLAEIPLWIVLVSRSTFPGLISSHTGAPRSQ